MKRKERPTLVRTHTPRLHIKVFKKKSMVSALCVIQDDAIGCLLDQHNSSLWHLSLRINAGTVGAGRSLLQERVHSTLHLEVVTDDVTFRYSNLLLSARRPTAALTALPLVSAIIALSDLSPASSKPGIVYSREQCKQLFSSKDKDPMHPISQSPCNGVLGQAATIQRHLFIVDVTIPEQTKGSETILWRVSDARTCPGTDVSGARCATLWEGAVEYGSSALVQLSVEPYFVGVHAQDAGAAMERQAPGLQAELRVTDLNGVEVGVAAQGALSCIRTSSLSRG
jgi:hypothetical protein